MNTLPSFSFLIQDIRQETNTVRRYIFDYGITPFEFYPGQFCVASHPRDPSLTAALTIATSPLRRDGFEFALHRSGNFGTRFYDEAKTGDVVQLKPAQGKFHIEVNDTRPMVYIAYDYAVTGARSFWQYHQDAQLKRPLHLLHPHRGPDNALFYDEFNSTQSDLRRYFPIRLAPDPSLSINQVALASALIGLQEPVLFIAGEGNDVKALTALAQQTGVPTQRIKTERWS
jgi:ferredoxin-NADP reductase